LERCREILGPDGAHLSDADLEELRAFVCGLADVALDVAIAQGKIAAADPANACATQALADDGGLP
jgi:hypothetical protein